MLEKIKGYICFLVGCIIFAGIGLGCWLVWDMVFPEPHPYLIIVIVNLIGYIGHGMTAFVIRKYVIKH